MPSLSERRIDAWTAVAAEPAVHAAERAIATGSSTVLADTLAVSTAAECRRRLAGVLELKDRAERDPRPSRCIPPGCGRAPKLGRGRLPRRLPGSARPHMIERWEWEGGAVMVDAIDAEADTSRQELEPSGDSDETSPEAGSKPG